MKSNNYLKYIPTEQIGFEIDRMCDMVGTQRKSFERKWYDHNFFDDGYHFKYLSRTTGKIVDVDAVSTNQPTRAIPKASRQIRGIANLLMGLEPTPVVFPEAVYQHEFGSPEEYEAAKKQSSNVAQKSAIWLENEWKDQHLKEKLIHMVILAAKHGVSYLQIWQDAVEEKIKTQVYDAFDIYTTGSSTDLYETPFIVKAVPQLISVIKANENFDKDQLDKISPDNKYASSEIKQAYMTSKYGSGTVSDSAATLILKEAFVKEYVCDANKEILVSKYPDIAKGKKEGDMVMRHAFSAGGIWLLDEYVDLKEYPFVDFRFEPGPIYQKAIIENFIPANKTLDIVVSRIEKWANTMVVGTWLKRKGENFEITNIPGGQVAEYSATPPQQMQMANVPAGIFDLISLMNTFIEEQGASTSALGQLPTGVRSGNAIESVKSTEYANLKIPSDMLKETVKRISERMMEIASNFIYPKTVYNNTPTGAEYFDIVGSRGVETREEMGMEVPETTIPISDEYRVEIEVESGLGYTQEGKKETARAIMEFMVPLAQQGLLSPEAMKIMIQRFLEINKFGNTREFMDAMNEGAGMLNDQELQRIKVAVLEAMKDAGYVGPEMDDKMVTSTKIGVIEALKDLQGGQNATNQVKQG